jgi:hypothetical protein
MQAVQVGVLRVNTVGDKTRAQAIAPLAHGGHGSRDVLTVEATPLPVENGSRPACGWDLERRQSVHDICP